jgi:hypothetical protein
MSGYIGTQPVPQATQTRDSFTCTAGQTSFATGGYTPQFLDVYLNGIKLAAADYTASNGSDVVLASGAALNDILEVVAYSSFEVVTDTVTNAGTVLNLDRTGSDGTILDLKKDGSTVGSIGTNAGQLTITNGQAGLRFDDVGSGRIVPFDTVEADAAIDLGRNNNRFKDLYLSGGVYLGGTGSANKLDDYEEGTWTPDVTHGSASFSNAVYTKVGRLVTLNFTISFSDITTASAVTVTGTPFSSSKPAVGSMMQRYSGSSYAFVPYLNGGNILFYRSSSTGSWYTKRHADYTSASHGVYVTITYPTSS